jgi:alkylhydroperoxidase/carboxymuconolactone decarboxylase family protein YurZ
MNDLHAEEPNAPDPEEIIARVIANRGDIFEEFKLFIRAMPRAYQLNQKVAGYVHQYRTLGTADQVLSLPMRELIATAQLCAKGDDRFAPNHVRKLWRLGVTNQVIFEAGLAIAMVVGWSTNGHVALAILSAGNASYPDGEIPSGGAPTELTPFAELAMGREAIGSIAEGLLEEPEWQYVAQIDPELAHRTAGLIDYGLLAGGAVKDTLLGPGPRELIAIAGLCARGEAELAARHIRRAYAYGMTKRQVLEAISCVIPMTGAVTVQIGARAMQMAEDSR